MLKCAAFSQIEAFCVTKGKNVFLCCLKLVYCHNHWCLSYCCYCCFIHVKTRHLAMVKSLKCTLILSCVSLSRMQWLLLQCLSLRLFFHQTLLLTVSCSLWHSAMEDSSHLPAISQDIRTLPADAVSTLQLSTLALVGCLKLEHSRNWKHSSNFYNALSSCLYTEEVQAFWKKTNTIHPWTHKILKSLQ